MDVEIEHLLFQQVEKPKNFLMLRIINVYSNRYRINLYIEIEENNLIKRKIKNSYFCHYSPGQLNIIPEPDHKTEEQKRKQRL